MKGFLLSILSTLGHHQSGAKKEKNKSHYDIKDEFARLGRRALIVYCLLVVSEQGAVPGGAGQSGQNFEFWREWDLNCSR